MTQGTSQVPNYRPRRRLARNTAIFAFFTALSRIVGLAREVVAAYFFGTGLSASAFTIASQIPNLMSNLFAQAALSAAFVPVFTDLLEHGRRREAFRLASTLFWLILIVLGSLTLVGIVLAGVILPLFNGPNFDGDLAGTLTQIMFPVVLLLGLTGLLVGILQSYDEFSIPALAPVVWNAVILILLVVLEPRFTHAHDIYAYALAWLVATVVQFLLIASALRRIDFRLGFQLDWRDPRVKQVFLLMLPVTIGLGIVNLDALINSTFGVLVNKQAPRAIQTAFLIYMLPQGVFSVAISTVLFPTLSRQASRRAPAEMRHTLANGMRQINLLLIPSAAGMMVLATPIIRLVFQRGEFTATSTHLTSLALFWFAFSLPFAGLNLLLTRTFFALQRPWIPTGLAAINMTVDVDSQHRPVQAARDPGPRDRHRGREHRHDLAASAPAADRVQRPDRGRADCDGHRQDRGGLDPRSGDRTVGVGAARPARRCVIRRTARFGRRRDCGLRRVLRVGGAAHARSGGATDRATGPRPPAGRARRSLRNVAGGAALLTWVPSPIRRTSATSRSSPTSTTASRRWQIGSSS